MRTTQQVVPIANYGNSDIHSEPASNKGFQTALCDVDQIRLPIGLKDINIEANSFAEAQSNFAGIGLTLTDNNGDWELT